ncbi:MAG: LuxR C-terminal-related transcriptional regulator [Rehaibacterium terrae]|uniref:response regulator transcription factor n=1 Tax=Rehaibacterium terrae TaxID=1341696 RepID=UPI003919E6F7
MDIVTVLLASPDRTFRLGLRDGLAGVRRFQVISETGTLRQVQVLAAGWNPALIVLDAVWLQAAPDLLSRLSTLRPDSRVMLCADTLSAPEVLAAVEQGVRGCIAKAAPAGTWRRALLAVHEGEVWIPRWLLVEALSDLLQLMPSGWLPTAAQLERLTERQREIVRWVAQGLSNKEIGRRLGISPTTVKTHLHNIFERVGVSGRQRLLVQTGQQQSVA